jgi:TetR/AcrR family transcriptional repressor of nem operon
MDVTRNPKFLRERAVRKSREEAAETRKRIVQAAASEFREKGIVATGLTDLMKAAGLTHGGFYKHFESKDQLVAEATAAAMETILGELATHSTVGGVIDTYLSAGHRGNPGSGCPLAANGDELSRADTKTREAATDGFKRLVEILTGKAGTAEARRKAQVAAVTMIGAMIMSRVVTDPKLSDEIIRETRKSLKEG